MKKPACDFLQSGKKWRQRESKKRIFLEPKERDKLLELGLAIGPAIRHVITIVSDSTFRLLSGT